MQNHQVWEHALQGIMLVHYFLEGKNKSSKYIPGSSGYVNCLRFGSFFYPFCWKGKHFIHLEDPCVFLYVKTMALENRTQAKFLFLPYSVPSCRIMGGLHQALIMLLGYDCLAFVCCFTAIDLLVKKLMVVIANANRQQKECHKGCTCPTPLMLKTLSQRDDWMAMLRKEASLRIAQNSTLALGFTPGRFTRDTTTGLRLKSQGLTNKCCQLIFI